MSAMASGQLHTIQVLSSKYGDIHPIAMMKNRFIVIMINGDLKKRSMNNQFNVMYRKIYLYLHAVTFSQKLVSINLLEHCILWQTLTSALSYGKH